MKLSNNPEIFQLMKRGMLLLFLAALVFTGAVFLSVYRLQQSMYDQITALLGTVLEHAPEAEEAVLEQLLRPGTETLKAGAAGLARYGIRREDLFLHDPFLQNHLIQSIGILFGLLLMLFLIISLLARAFLRRQYGRIQDITVYARRLQRMDYALDIRDNQEGEISLLKNEIYKITLLLKEQAEQLKQEKRLLSDSLADISHQLKTPLTSLKVLMDLLTQEPSENMRETFQDRIRSQINRLLWLTEALLKFSKLDSDTLVMKQETVSVPDLVQRALKALEVPAEIKGLNITVQGNPDVGYTGDAQWSREALINILKNCMEHTPEGGTIDITFEENPIFTGIVISDTGSGIDQGDLPHIFQRFYKGKNAGEDSVGIGLNMAAAIVSKQNGDITVKSEKGRGAVFTLRFFKGIL